MEKVRVFVSYSWDGPQHRAWVKQLADTLEEIEEVHVTWDGYDLDSLVDKNLFMEEGIHNADFVLVVATAKYKQRADARLGGVGLETYMGTAVHWDGLLQNKRSNLIVILREADSTPRYLQGHFYLDFRREDEYPARIEELLSLLRGTVVAKRPTKRRSIATPRHDFEDDPVIAFIKHRRSQLLAEGLRPVLRDDGTRHEHFVNLELRVPRDQDPAGHDPNRSRFDRLRDLLEAQSGVGAWVLLGDPGGGKSTLLFAEELQCAEACLSSTAASLELCIRLPLSDYNADGTVSPAAWIDEQIRGQCPPGVAPVPTLSSLQARFSVRLLLDGLNEIAGTDQERSAAQTTLLIRH